MINNIFKWRRVYKDWDAKKYAKRKIILDKNEIEYRNEVINTGYRPGCV